jgi:hypothetical protein
MNPLEKVVQRSFVDFHSVDIDIVDINIVDIHIVGSLYICMYIILKNNFAYFYI